MLHLHRLADHLEDLRARVRAFLDHFHAGSTDPLRSVGLTLADGSFRKTPDFK